MSWYRGALDETKVYNSMDLDYMWYGCGVVLGGGFGEHHLGICENGVQK